MTRRIFICTIGSSPQVATETVWALKKRSPPWVPDEIHVITTSEGLSTVRAALQAPDGRMAELFHVSSPPVTVYVPCRSGKPFVFKPVRSPGDWTDGSSKASSQVALPPDVLNDVNSLDDAAIMGNVILRVVARAAGDPASEIHVSLAGGRKTMSAHALMALSLVGRPQDEASHVLVGADFESNGDFWHPDQSGGPIHQKHELRMADPPPPTLDPAAAAQGLVLISTPAPLMRYEVKKGEPLEKMDLAKLIEQQNVANLLATAPRVVLDTRSNTVSVGRISAKLSPKLFAVYRLVATACAEGWRGTGPDGVGANHKGWLSYDQIAAQAIASSRRQTSRMIITEMSRFLRAAVAADGGDVDDDRSVTEWEQNFIERPSLHMKKGVVQRNLSPSLTNLEKELRKRFGAASAAALATRDARGPRRFGLVLPPTAIETV